MRSITELGIAGVGTFPEWLVLMVAPASSGLSLDRSRWVSRSLCGIVGARQGLACAFFSRKCNYELVLAIDPALY